MPHPIQPGGGGGGGGGTPSLPFTSVQFNNAGAFGGSPNFTWNGTGVVVTDGAGTTDTLSPGTLLFTTAGTGTVSVKTAGGGDGPLNLDILDLQVNGASGLAGQVLTSGGPGASPTWSAVPAASGWVDGGTNVYLTTLTDQVAMGTTTPLAGVKQTIQNDAGGSGILVRATAGTSEAAYNTRQFADTVDRFALQTAGIHLWGSGAAAADIRQQRTGTLAFAFNHPTAATTITWSFVGTLLTPSRRVLTNTVTAAALSLDANPTIYDVVLCDPTAGAQTITLPNPVTAGNSGRRYTVKRVTTSANTVTVNSAGAATIDGLAAQVLAGGTLNAITVVTDGTAWWIV